MRFSIAVTFHCEGPSCEKTTRGTITFRHCRADHLHTTNCHAEGWFFSPDSDGEVAALCSKRCLELLEALEKTPTLPKS